MCKTILRMHPFIVRCNGDHRENFIGQTIHKGRLPESKPPCAVSHEGNDLNAKVADVTITWTVHQ